MTTATTAATTEVQEVPQTTAETETAETAARTAATIITAPGEVAKKFFGVGKRKTSIARLYITPGEGKILVNRRPFETYFGREALLLLALQPMEVTGNAGKFDLTINVKGGGPSSQAQAVRHGLARALLSLNPDYRKPLHRNGFLTRDARRVERKKYGHRKARRSTQFSKR